MKRSTKKTGPIFGTGPNCGPEIVSDPSDVQVRLAISGAIHEALEDTGMTRRDLADLCDVSDETLRNWLKKKRTPHLAEAMRSGRKVAQIENAIIELLRFGKSLPQPEPCVAILIDQLQEFQDMGGDVGQRAKRAIRKYSLQQTRGRA